MSLLELALLCPCLLATGTCCPVLMMTFTSEATFLVLCSPNPSSLSETWILSDDLDKGIFNSEDYPRPQIESVFSPIPRTALCGQCSPSLLTVNKGRSLTDSSQSPVPSRNLALSRFSSEQMVKLTQNLCDLVFIRFS